MSSLKKRVFVVGAYIPAGGTFMAYHLGRILQLDFGFDGVAVGGDTPHNGVFEYDVVFPSVSVKEMEASIMDEDILIANPSFSRLMLGLRCRGRKLMYIQGFNTFDLLDCNFDHYVTVSKFVRHFISTTYDIDTTVIPPFIRAERFPRAVPWKERPELSLLVSLKGNNERQYLVFARLREFLAKRIENIHLDNVLEGNIPHGELLERMGQSRYFLTLAATEGFGLMPLEAMAMGTTVLGFDGFGGRDYMQPGINCAVTAYGDIRRLADEIASTLGDPKRAEVLAEAGRATANLPIYTYDHFRSAWRAQLAGFLGVTAP